MIDGIVERVTFSPQHVHFVVDATAFGAQLPNVFGAFLQHCRLAEFGVGILLQLRYERVQRIEAVFDVVAAFLFGMYVTGTPLGRLTAADV